MRKKVCHAQTCVIAGWIRNLQALNPTRAAKGLGCSKASPYVEMGGDAYGNLFRIKTVTCASAHVRLIRVNPGNMTD